MNQKIRNSIASLAYYVPFSILSKGVEYPPVLPFYHVVSNSSLDYINSYKVRTEKKFEEELDYLLMKFKPVSLEEILTNPDSSKMHLTFDDGLKECSTIIAPILKRKGIPATFFVSPNFVDNKALFHRFKRSILESKGILKTGGKKYFITEVEELDALASQNNIGFNAYKPYLSLDEIHSLQNNGFTIGAHSLNHPEMWLLNTDDQFTQIVESMQWVNDNFHPEIKAFSFPFTDDGIQMSLFEKLKSNKVVDATFGTAGLKFDSVENHFQRIPVELAENWSIKKVLHFEYLYFKIRNLLSANIVKRD